MFVQSRFDPPDPTGGENLPEKTGAARFFEILGDECAHLLLINILFFLTCVPVVTIPAALFALHRSTRKMTLDYLVRASHYMDAFRRSWKQGYIAFGLTALPLAVSGTGAWFYLRQAEEQVLFFLPFLLCSTIFLITLLSSVHLYALLDMGYGTRDALRLAPLLGVGKPLRTVLAVVCCYGLPLAAVLALPISLAYLLLIGVSLPDLLGHFFLRTVWKQHLAQGSHVD